MEWTTEQGCSGGAADANDDRRESVEQARAQAYLDLWEQHVVQTALYGPVVSCRPAKS